MHICITTLKLYIIFVADSPLVCWIIISTFKHSLCIFAELVQNICGGWSVGVLDNNYGGGQARATAPASSPHIILLSLPPHIILLCLNPPYYAIMPQFHKMRLFAIVRSHQRLQFHTLRVIWAIPQTACYKKSTRRPHPPCFYQSPTIWEKGTSGQSWQSSQHYQLSGCGAILPSRGATISEMSRRRQKWKRPK